MDKQEATITSVGNLDIGRKAIVPDTHHREKHHGQTIEIVDYTRVGEYGDSHVYAYANPDTGEFLGLMNTSLLPEGNSTRIAIFEEE